MQNTKIVPQFYLLRFICYSFNNWVRLSSQFLIDWRLAMQHTSQSLIGSEQTQLLFSLIFGSNEPLSYHQRHVFKVIGMLHILSASGFNLKLFSNLAESVLSRLNYLPQKLKTVLAGLSGLLFFGLSSRSLSLKRALVMSFGALLVRRLLLRQLAALRLLVYILITWVILNPEVARSLSWQMSVAAVSGIIWLMPVFSGLLKHYIFGKKQRFFTSRSRYTFVICSYFVQNVSLSLAAQVGLLPILAATWGEVNFFGLLAALILSPVVVSLIYLGLAWFGICSVIALVFKDFSLFFSLAGIPGLWLTASVISFLGLVDRLASLGENYLWKIGEINHFSLAAWYCFWILIGWLWRRSQRKKAICELQL